jgi:hypothetical protein
MTIPGVGQLTALAFVAAIDDPSRIRQSRDIAPIWAWFQDGIYPKASKPRKSIGLDPFREQYPP